MKLMHWGRKGLGGSSVMESSGTEDCWLLLLEETVNLVYVLCSVRFVVGALCACIMCGRCTCVVCVRCVCVRRV